MNDDQQSPIPPTPNLILSVGTQVVTRVELRNARNEVVVPPGAVGVVIEAPRDQLHSYRVRFPDGLEGSYRRQQLTIRKHFQQAGYNLPEIENEVNLYDYVIYRCIVGSRAFGLAGDASDTDWRGIYLPSADLHWSLAGVPEQIESKATEETYWELQKFLNMALKANPNVLECLYTPLVELATPLAQELLAMRHKFLSKLIYQTYNGYVLSQFKKLEQDLRNRGEIRWKHAMHLIRLLLSGIHVLEKGELMVAVTADQRAQLLAVKQAEMEWEEVDRWRLTLHKEFEAAFAATPLPERPDYTAANAFLLKARRSMVN